MSEGSLPENWPDAARWLLGGVFVFVAGFEGYVMLWDGRTVAGITSVLIAFALTAVLVRWKHLEAWAGAQFGDAARRTVTHPATWLGTLMMVLLLIALSPFVEEPAKPSWSIGIAIAGSVGLLFTFVNLAYRWSISQNPTEHVDTIHPPTITISRPALVDSLYVADMRFTFGDLEKDRHSELSMRVFNGSGQVVELSNLSGQVKFSTPNSAEGAGVLPAPAFRSNITRTIGQLKEWLLILDQRVPATEADKLISMIEAGVPIHFDLRELTIGVFGHNNPSNVERLPVWDGVTYQKGSGFGRIVMLTGGAIRHRSPD